jgi:hypothetical protein
MRERGTSCLPRARTRPTSGSTLRSGLEWSQWPSPAPPCRRLPPRMRALPPRRRLPPTGLLSVVCVGAASLRHRRTHTSTQCAQSRWAAARAARDPTRSLRRCSRAYPPSQASRQTTRRQTTPPPNHTAAKTTLPPRMLPPRTLPPPNRTLGRIASRRIAPPSVPSHLLSSPARSPLISSFLPGSPLISRRRALHAATALALPGRVVQPILRHRGIHHLRPLPPCLTLPTTFRRPSAARHAARHRAGRRRRRRADNACPRRGRPRPH